MKNPLKEIAPYLRTLEKNNIAFGIDYATPPMSLPPTKARLEENHIIFTFKYKTQTRGKNTVIDLQTIDMPIVSTINGFVAKFTGLKSSETLKNCYKRHKDNYEGTPQTYVEVPLSKIDKAKVLELLETIFKGGQQR